MRYARYRTYRSQNEVGFSAKLRVRLVEQSRNLLAAAAVGSGRSTRGLAAPALSDSAEPHGIRLPRTSPRPENSWDRCRRDSAAVPFAGNRAPCRGRRSPAESRIRWHDECDREWQAFTCHEGVADRAFDSELTLDPFRRNIAPEAADEDIPEASADVDVSPGRRSSARSTSSVMTTSTSDRLPDVRNDRCSV